MMSPTEYVLVAFDEIFPDKWLVMALLTPDPDAAGRMTVAETENTSCQYVILSSEVIARGSLEVCHEARRMHRQGMSEVLTTFLLADAEASKAAAARAKALDAAAQKSREQRSIPNVWDTTRKVFDDRGHAKRASDRSGTVAALASVSFLTVYAGLLVLKSAGWS
ncbi:hypothetical protein L1787_05555 [Acuticoccus sp. M5D2P5]|uniref:hypothetical protein n=1 Tax=Acuticoccus kalidii TaxID=2910977 RepID=UPI001F18B32C|nr:hypothetical protein [Acuticoccus kalidii]MCF3932879.1 hypothetical protein [Acuticoccus kalidii]